MSDTQQPPSDSATHSTTNRRDFLKASAAVGIGAWVVGRGAWADETNPTGGSRSPNEKINIACIGVGGKGDSDSKHAGMFGNVVGICDVDDKALAKKAEAFPKAEKFNDFRKMLDTLGKGVDAVTVSIPDHNHAVAAMMAVKMGKHVYCQKPLTRTIKEARMLRETAKKMGVCTQMGNQGTATNGLRRGVEILRAGILGPIKEVHIWTDRPIWPQAPKIVSRPPAMEPPEYLHWDQWIGPAPMRPYAEYSDANGKRGKGAYHTFNWRGWWDFGTGALGDMGCHTANMPYMGLDLGAPTTLEGKAGELNDETYPAWATVNYTFAAKGKRGPVKLTWWEGHKPDAKAGGAPVRNIPGHNITMGFDLPQSGSLVVGEKGMLMSISDYGEGLRLIYNGETEGFANNAPKFLPRHEKGDQDENHKAEWIAAIKANKPEMALSNWDYAGMLTEFILLGNVAIKTGKKLEWDFAGMTFKNDKSADKLLHRDYREGWSL